MSQLVLSDAKENWKVAFLFSLSPCSSFCSFAQLPRGSSFWVSFLHPSFLSSTVHTLNFPDLCLLPEAEFVQYCLLTLPSPLTYFVMRVLHLWKFFSLWSLSVIGLLTSAFLHLLFHRDCKLLRAKSAYKQSSISPHEGALSSVKVYTDNDASSLANWL